MKKDKIDFNVSNKIIQDNENNKNNDFNKSKDFNTAVTFLTNDYIKEHVQMLANANNLTLKDMFNKILIEYIEDNQDVIEVLKQLQNK